MHYISGSNKCANADKCRFSHEFTVHGLARHNELNPGHKKKYDLLKDQQIMEPIFASIAKFATTLMLRASASRSAAAVPTSAAT